MFITLFSYLSTAAWKQKVWDGNISLLECVNIFGSKFWRLKSLQPLSHRFVLQSVGGLSPCYCTHLGSWEQRRWWSGKGTPWFGSFCTFCSRRPGLHGREWLKEGCSVEENHSWLHSWNWINRIISAHLLLLYSLNNNMLTYKSKNILWQNCDWSALRSSHYQNLLRDRTREGRTLGQMQEAL